MEDNGLSSLMEDNGTLTLDILNVNESPRFTKKFYVFSATEDSVNVRLRLGPIWGSQDDNQANMEMPMY
jgi:predicted DNA binding CopG/RHH family protein